MREVKKEDFEGRTIQSIDTSSTNVIIFIFQDGSKLELWAEDAIYTSAGYIPGFYIEDSNFISEYNQK